MATPVGGFFPNSTYEEMFKSFGDAITKLQSNQQTLQSQQESNLEEINELRGEVEKGSERIQELESQQGSNLEEIKKLQIEQQLTAVAHKSLVIAKESNTTIQLDLLKVSAEATLTIAHIYEISKIYMTAFKEQLGKNATNEIARKAGFKAVKESSNNISKLIPVAGAIMSVCFAARRYQNRDYWGCAGEIVCAVASATGPFASIAAAITLLAVDILQSNSSAKLKDVSEAYECLGIEDNDNPSRDEVDRAFRAISAQYHPDKAAAESQEVQKAYTDFMKIINDAKAFIYQHRKWT